MMEMLLVPGGMVKRDFLSALLLQTSPDLHPEGFLSSSTVVALNVVPLFRPVSDSADKQIA